LAAPAKRTLIFICQHDSDDALGHVRVGGVRRVIGEGLVEIDPMEREAAESCPLLMITLVINTGAPPMTTNIDTSDVCCVALELSKSSWVCAVAIPGDSQAVVHKIKASDVDRLIGILNSSKAKAVAACA
jgi:hypothetical protein